ncbi:MAG: (d)CMP kinase [Bacteroidia bacterium]|nr:(d)CMP kinase [Bacteroidia bacterium]
MKLTIAIDGYSSCGKSTLARSLASRIGYKYIDTGAMYRAVTLFCMQNGIIKPEGSFDAGEIVKALPSIDIGFLYDPRKKSSDTLLNGSNVEHDIRTMEVSSLVSPVSAIPEVRTKMVALQRRMGKGKGVVLDGRDIGTNVFPDAELKIFMTAETEVRVQRRFDELHAKGSRATLAEVRENLMARDQEDTTRKTNPLRKAADAVVLDNSDLDKEEQLQFVLRLVQERIQ